jgi:hypothetical protein
MWTMESNTLTEPQRNALRATWAVFAAEAKWPLASYVDTVLAHEHDYGLDDALVDLPAGLIYAELASDQGLIRATVPALALLEEAHAEVNMFVSVVVAGAEREAAFLPESPFSLDYDWLRAADLELLLDRDSAESPLVTAEKLYELLRIENLPVEQHSGSRADWRLRVDRRLRRYRGIQTITDYLERRPAAPARGSLAGELEQGRIALRPATDLVAISRDPYLFILMPFTESWSQNVRDVIEQAARSVRQSHPNLTWDRADDFTDTGRITDQIMRAIERSDMIVADVTTSNPNVMFELGYADALAKPIIVLNQQVDTAPFDIKNWRQISYELSDLKAARDQLTAFLESTLRAISSRRRRSERDD